MEGSITVGHLVQDNKAISFLLWTIFLMNGAISIEDKWDEINVGISAGMFKFPVLGIGGVLIQTFTPSRPPHSVTLLFFKAEVQVCIKGN